MASPAAHNHESNANTEKQGENPVPDSASASAVSSMAMEMKNTSEYFPLNASEDPKDRPGRTGRINRKALLSFSVVVVLVITIITITAVFVTYSDQKKDREITNSRRDSTNQTRFQFDDIFNGKFFYDTPNEKWISDNAVLKVERDGIYKYNVATNQSVELLSNEQLVRLGSSAGYYSLSPDERWILLTSESKKKYRYSTVAKYFALNIESNTVVTISTDGKTSSSFVQYISWGSKENSIVFVSKNDIYWIKSIDDANPKAIRVTSTGEEKIIFNGIPDWVYEEEILGQRPAVVVSPDDKHLCYVTFNDTEVPLFEISLYDSPEAAYTRIQDIAYPKPGFPNPQITIYISNVESNKKVKLEPPDDIRKSDFYFTNLVWASSKSVSVTWLNRDQTLSVVMLCSTIDGSCVQNYKLVVADGWVRQSYMNPVFSADGSFYINVLPKNEGKNGNFFHIAKVPSTKNANNDVVFLTDGEWDVKKTVSFDEKRGLVYYESSEITPTAFNLYSVDLKGKKKCLSCSMVGPEAKGCRNYYSSFSTKSSWYTLTCIGPSVPTSWFRSTHNDAVILIQSNKGLRETLAATSMPSYKYSTFKTADGSYDLHLRELRPPDFDENKKYAVLFDVYGGPSSQAIIENFDTGFDTYLASNFDIIICQVDGRGTGSRGRKFEYAVYDQLGEFERNDTLDAARFMQSKKYVDPDRIAIWGWSYGGFLTSFILSTQEERVFRSGVAVAPVTDWRYYDSIYTERYMGQPSKSDNFIGYEYSSVLKHADKIPDDSFLLIHGTGDDNVHFQNTAQLVSVLTEAKIQFEMQIYTDKHHGLEGSNIQKHLFRLITDFLKRKLGL